MFAYNVLMLKLLDRPICNRRAELTQYSYLYLYHCYIDDITENPTPKYLEALNVVPVIRYYLILNTKSRKTKFTLLLDDQSTLITMSLGTLLKHTKQFRKSAKRSYRANTLLLRFIQNAVIKLVGNKPYIFILRGLNTKVFGLINFFTFLQENSKMALYVLNSRISFAQPVFKKIKSIKRKLQRKNALRVADVQADLKKYSRQSFFV